MAKQGIRILIAVVALLCVQKAVAQIEMCKMPIFFDESYVHPAGAPLQELYLIPHSHCDAGVCVCVCVCVCLCGCVWCVWLFVLCCVCVCVCVYAPRILFFPFLFFSTCLCVCVCVC